MALILKDRVKETTTTVGTGTLTLAGASDTFEPFSTIGNGNTTYYAIVAQGNDNWEVGIGTVGTGTLSRDTVLASSNFGAKISFPAGTKDVFVTYPAGKVVSKDDATGINSGISLADYVDFDTAAAPATAVGRLFWNDTFGTLDMGLKGGNVTLHLGQKQVTQVINKTGASLSAANYQVVKIDGAQGQRLKIVLAQANNDANSADTIGVVNETIANNQEGFVCTVGTITNLNTTGSLQGESWNDGDVLYLSGTTAGQLTNIKPSAPTHTVIVGFVIYAHNNQGKIYVKIDNGYELDELHNVSITSPTNGQILKYNSGLWQNQNDTAGTVTSVAATAGTGISVSGSPITSSGTLTITNTAPDQVVSLTAGSNVTVTGTYPSFTIAATGGGGSGTVTDVSVVSANGFSGSVANSTTTPAITLSTSISGLLKGSAGALAAASASDVPDLPQSKITNLVTDLAAKAPLASPALTGTPTAPTAAVGTDTTQLATTAFVNAEIANDAPSKTGTGASGTWGISVTGNAGTVDNGVYTTGNQTIVGTKTFSSDVILSGIAANSVLYLTASKYVTGGATLSFDGSTLDVMGTVQATSFVGALTGNASTVTNGVYTTGDQTIGGTKTFSSTISGSVSGNAGTVTNGVYTTGDQTIGGTKTFSSTITGSITGNAGTVTDGVYLSGTQTITGNKTFTGSVTMGQSGGGEGGEIFWLDPVQGTVVTDVPASGAFRVFQASGTAKGAYIDLANCAGGVGSLLLHSTNYNSYAPTLTGTGASGSWGISVTGNAGTVTNGVYTTGNQTIGGTKTFSSTISGSVSGNAGTATTLQATPTINNVTFAGNANITVPRVRALDDRTLAPADGSANYVTAYFTSWANDNTSPYADALLFRTWGDGSGGNDNLVTFRKNALGMRIWQQTSGSATAFSSFKDVAWTDGTNATGTWTISTSGNAGTVTNGVYTTGDQTIGGNKTFTGTTSITNGPLVLPTATGTNSFISGTGDGASLSTYNFALSGWSGMAFYNPTVGGVYPTSTTGVVNFRDGIIEMRGSLRAPIFYDSADTSYYLDPANTGTSMVVAGDVVASNLKTSANTALSLGLYTGTAFNTGGAAISLRGSTTGYNDNGMEFYAGNSERMRINSSGNVGIGTTSPTFRLVSANSSFDGGWLYSTGVVSILGLGGYFDASAGAFSLRYDRSTGNITFNGGSRDTPTERMRIDGSGNVIASTSMYAPIFYDSNNSAYYLDPNNAGTSLNVAGSIVAGGNVTAYSDIRVKDNIENITDAIDKLSQIRGVTYTRTDLDDKERKYAGVIAQEIEQVLPEAVFDNGKVKGVDYNATIALLIEAVKEQQGQINELKLTIEQLKGN